MAVHLDMQLRKKRNTELTSQAPWILPFVFITATVTKYCFRCLHKSALILFSDQTSYEVRAAVKVERIDIGHKNAFQ